MVISSLLSNYEAISCFWASLTLPDDQEVGVYGGYYPQVYN